MFLVLQLSLLIKVACETSNFNKFTIFGLKNINLGNLIYKLE